MTEEKERPVISIDFGNDVSSEKNYTMELLQKLDVDAILLSGKTTSGQYSGRSGVSKYPIGPEAIERSDMLIITLWKTYHERFKRELEEAIKEKIPAVVLVNTLEIEKRDKEISELIEWVSKQPELSITELLPPRFKLELNMVLLKEFAKRAKPSMSLSWETMMSKGKDIIENCKKVVVLARTPIPLVGPVIEFDVDYNKAFDEALEKSKKGDKKLYCGFVSEAMRKHIRDNPKRRSIIRKNIERLYGYCGPKFTCEDNFRLVGTPSDHHITFAVGDDRFVFWMKPPEEQYRAFSFYGRNQEIANTLNGIFNEACTLDAIDEIMKVLDLNVEEQGNQLNDPVIQEARQFANRLRRKK